MFARTVVLAVLLAGLVACDGQSGVVRPLVDSTRADANSPCSNPTAIPEGAFRLIFTTGDTSAVFVNRYEEPHHSADTIWTPTSAGMLAIIRWNADPHYCLSLYDSLRYHMPDVRDAFLIP